MYKEEWSRNCSKVSSLVGYESWKAERKEGKEEEVALRSNGNGNGNNNGYPIEGVGI